MPSPQRTSFGSASLRAPAGRSPCAPEAARVLFDLDGTLTDPREGITASLRFAFERLGLPSPPEAVLAGAIGPPLGDTFRAHLPHAASDLVARAIDLYRERFAAEGWRENAVYPHVPDLLAALRARGWPAAVATSKPTVFAERITRHLGLREHFAAVYGSELDGTRGAKPELLAHVLAAERAAPERTVMIGDRRHDVEGARAVGARAIAVTWGYGARDELERAGADWICDTAEEVLAALDSALR